MKLAIVGAEFDRERVRVGLLVTIKGAHAGAVGAEAVGCVLLGWMVAVRHQVLYRVQVRIVLMDNAEIQYRLEAVSYTHLTLPTT